MNSQGSSQRRSKPGCRQYVGNLHIHSRYSDGSWGVSRVVQAAAEAGLDFIIFNDHDYMTDRLHLEAEGYRSGVLTLMGLEIGGRFHHYLAFDLKELIRGETLSPQEVIDRVNGQGGFGFLAHPFEKGMRFMEHSVAYTWNELDVSGYSGICIWNFSSRWKERVRTFFHGLLFLLFKSRLLKGPSAETLSFWDRTALTRKVAAVGGSDAHGWVFRRGGLRVVPLSYGFVFTGINNHILLPEPLSENFEEAKRQVYEALKAGRLFIAHDNLAPAGGFEFWFETDKRLRFTMGEESPHRNGMLYLTVPGGRRTRVQIIRNGNLLFREPGRPHMTFRVSEPGVYRAEVYLRVPLFGWRPWIFSNPVYLQGAASSGAR